MSMQNLRGVAAQFGLEFDRLRPDLAVAGSPERTLFRAVLQDARGYLFLLERIAAEDVPRKRAIAATLDDLFRAGVAGVQPYLVGAGGERVIAYDQDFWQIAPYLRGLDVPRPGWIHEDWRGELLADFMITLRACSGRIPRQRHGVFSIAAFVRDLAGRIAGRDRQQRHPALLPRLAPALELLDEFALVHNSLPLAFCHGDLHPLNVIWGLRGIKAVIDWEFCGHKVELYDVANLIGCAGIENPEGLRGKLALALIKRLREAGIMAEYSWVHLHELVIALRFAWLSEWLRSDDEEMVELETELIGVLVRERAMLRGIWAL
jgi:homoserine kinase type II